ncbi:MAG TPA: DUF58 domain-containing protein [Bryobacteraceae bacterium]|jgi:uncharacterized protein (DUF58 family)|nr:DUF58 domain-containing protein [Bryobacteraceae bacterium]
MHEPLLDSTFLERLERLTLHWNKSFSGLVGGHNPSRFGGSGQEFLDHRLFHHGDDLRAVNWRAYMRLEKLFLKMFQVEPRVPVRLMLDTSASMTAGHTPGQLSKFDFARKLAAALCYIGLVRLDTITLQPFSTKLLDPFLCGGGRHRFQPAEEFLRLLEPKGRTKYLDAVRQFIGEYSQRGLLIVISDFLDDGDCLHPLQYLADFGHELYLIQVWGDEDRVPAGDGEMELVDAETGDVLKLGLSNDTRSEYTNAFDAYAGEIRRLALRNGGRYAGLPSSASLEESIFGALVRTQGVA